MFPLLAYLRAFVRTRHDLGLEILALRQQVVVLKRKRPRPRLNNLDRLFWIALRRCWSRWSDTLILVRPETVVGWHRAGFRLFWRLRSRGGGRKIDAEVFEIVRRMARENPTWGAPRIHGELLMLGFEVSERTVSRYLARRERRPGNAANNWLTFLNNHREAIAAMDFFTVPTITFRLLYCFFAIDHGRRRILHFNVTAHPTAEWVMQQLRETFSDADHHRFVIMDRDSKFNPEVIELLESSGINAARTSVRSPWQNGVAERWVGSARRECFDHVIAINEAHVRRIAREYMAYYHADRTHDGLGKDAPNGREIEARPAGVELVGLPRVGGLHHRYCWKTAA
jgi:transposase InsO family protein